MTRLEQLRRGLEEPLLVTTPPNVRYLTGFESSNAALFVGADRTMMFTDFRYAEAARRVEGVELVEVERALMRGLAGRLEGTIGFEADHVTYSGYRTLVDAGLDLVPRSGLVERLRAVKDEGELELILKAAEITSEAYERLAEERFVGRSERELAWRLGELMFELGSHGVSFPATVASGPNGATPHAETGDRIVEPGEAVVVDSGATVEGYAADCTRTFATGELPEELEHAYRVCLEAQQAGLEAVVPGVSGREADAAARQVIEGAGLGEAFGHGLGHGVGLQVHEAPSLRPESEDTLEPNNVVTVEPGIYLSGRGGVRIEDLVVVREGGPVILTSFRKELVRVA